MGQLYPLDVVTVYRVLGGGGKARLSHARLSWETGEREAKTINLGSLYHCLSLGFSICKMGVMVLLEV